MGINSIIKEFRIDSQELNESIAALSFNPKFPHKFSYTHATKVSIYDVRTKEKTASLNKFKDYATCITYRPDGKLLLAGEQGGSAAVFDIANNSVLRRLKGHSDSILSCAFSMSKAATGSKDKSIRLWDIAAAECVLTWENAHNDQVK